MINAAGLGADYVDREFGYDRFHVTPRRGELLVYDKLARTLIDKIVLPVPTSPRQGCSGQPDDLRQRDARPHRGRPPPTVPRRRRRKHGFEFLLDKGSTLMPHAARGGGHRHVRRLRAATDHGDYLVEVDHDQRYVLVGGIRSTGLTSGWRWPSTSANCSPRPGVLDSRTHRTCHHHPGCRTSARLHSPVSGRRTHRVVTGIRQGRLLLRARHRGRDPRRVSVADPPGQRILELAGS